MRILLIDDDDLFSQNLIEKLYNNNYIIDYCKNVYETYNNTNYDYDLIVIDLMLPPTYNQEGIALLDYFKKRFSQVPIIMISQKSEKMTTIVSTAFKKGINVFLDKNDPNFFIDLCLNIKEIEGKMNDKIFISYGHNELLKFKLKDFIQNQLHREPLILSETANKGLTVVEKLEQASALCNVAIVLLTKDDETKDGGMRARQNVIHEIGFFQGKYGRKNVILLCEHGVEIFSNISGILRIEFETDHFDEIYEQLRRELGI